MSVSPIFAQGGGRLPAARIPSAQTASDDITGLDLMGTAGRNWKD